MLTSIALLLVLRQAPALSLKAGFYTLQDVANALAKQNVQVAVAPSCADETYAIRAENTDWDKFRAALQADERLEISETKHGWQIERSVTVKRDESRARDAYASYALNTVHEFFAGIAQRCAELEPQTQQEREAAVEKARKDAGNDPLKADIAQQLYLFSAEHDMPFSDLAIPSIVTDSSMSGFGRVLSTNLYAARYAFVPDGDLAKFPLAPRDLVGSDAKRRWADNVHLLFKLAWDPVTLQMAYRFVMFEGPAVTVQMGGDGIDFVPKRFHLTIPIDAVWSATQRSALAARAVASAKALKTEAATASATMPGRSVRAGEALLRAAEAGKANLVYYVSPMTDYLLPNEENRSIASVVADVDKGQIEAAALQQAVNERTGTKSFAMGPSFVQPATLTATASGDFCVIRNEMRFLDEPDTQTLISTEIENGLLANKPTTLEQIAGAVDKASPSGHVSSDALDFCNPVAFRPFASALEASPDLMKVALAATETKVEEIPLSKLDSAARSRLLSEIQRCSPLCDATTGFAFDPLVVPQLIDQFGGDLTLRIAKGRGSVTFSVLHLSQVLWTATAKNLSAA
ncbi:MAG TPA: hypothetical protein VHE55_06430 [Fimbriimonadaceae bacterium]|nr:hypothetical protein [Fimbriimonadaceae bacterium]